MKKMFALFASGKSSGTICSCKYSESSPAVLSSNARIIFASSSLTELTSITASLFTC